MSPCEVPPTQPIVPIRGRFQQLLQEFSVTQNGFLPEDLPLSRLPDSYYDPWEALITHLSTLIENRTLREQVDKLPVLSTNRLITEPEKRRAYVVLSFLTHGYIWGGKTAAQVRPFLPFLSCFFLFLIANTP
jgi:indoleamine 2,3-dioxygenase